MIFSYALDIYVCVTICRYRIYNVSASDEKEVLGKVLKLMERIIPVEVITKWILQNSTAESLTVLLQVVLRNEERFGLLKTNGLVIYSAIIVALQETLQHSGWYYCTHVGFRDRDLHNALFSELDKLSIKKLIVVSVIGLRVSAKDSVLYLELIKELVMHILQSTTFHPSHGLSYSTSVLATILGYEIFFIIIHYYSRARNHLYIFQVHVANCNYDRLEFLQEIAG